jgi:predicted phage-related endonuclease
MEDDKEWLAWRREGLGGSDIGVLLGLSNWGSPWSLWCDKAGLIPPSPETQRQTIGKAMESVLADLFRRETGLYVVGEQTWCRYPSWDVARCTVDGFVVEAPADTIQAQHLDMQALTDVWEAKTDGRRGWDEIPPAIRAQAAWNAGVNRLAGTWITVMFSGFRVEHIYVPFDPEDFAFMLERAREFWALVEAGTPPDIDGSDATAAAIAHVWPNHVPESTADLTHLAEIITARGELKDHERELAGQIKDADNRIKVALGDAEIGAIGGVPMFTYRTQEGRKTTCPECGHTTQSDPFRVLRSATRKKAA